MAVDVLTEIEIARPCTEVAAYDASTYPYVHLVRGALLEELGRLEEARDSLQLALQNARNPAERQQLSARVDRLSRSNKGGNDR